MTAYALALMKALGTGRAIGELWYLKSPMKILRHEYTIAEAEQRLRDLMSRYFMAVEKEEWPAAERAYCDRVECGFRTRCWVRTECRAGLHRCYSRSCCHHPFHAHSHHHAAASESRGAVASAMAPSVELHPDWNHYGLCHDLHSDRLLCSRRGSCSGTDGIRDCGSRLHLRVGLILRQFAGVYPEYIVTTGRTGLSLRKTVYRNIIDVEEISRNRAETTLLVVTNHGMAIRLTLPTRSVSVFYEQLKPQL